ncbi:methyltransferase domain-containing protein [Azospirillum sp. 11R-A]|uniref:class I SAM-dependent methyltransferase n=1 Tax=Azospirillum sp. 11R-A TaxID=3111634 RepID=UPI003C25AF0D
MMRFLAKVAIQRLIGTVPGGAARYERTRRRRILADLEEVTVQKLGVAGRYLEILRAAGGTEAEALTDHLEIGGGWLPVIPLILRRHGLARQTIIDVARLMRPEDAAAAAAILDRLDPAAVPLAPAADEPPAGWLERLGIAYHAPLSPPLPFPDAGFDLITATQVLQYPASDQLRAIHRDAARLLRPGGLYLLSIELTDLYHHFDPALPRFHFLRYSETTWRRWFDNPYTPLNRLRAVQHRTLLEEAPFDVLFWETTGGGTDDLAELRRAPPHADFAHLPDRELARDGLIALARRR